jgi:hypothetical protein
MGNGHQLVVEMMFPQAINTIGLRRGFYIWLPAATLRRFPATAYNSLSCPGLAVRSKNLYTKDTIGKTTNITDDAQQTIFFRKQCLDPSDYYTFDVTYRLIKGRGREYLAKTRGVPNASLYQGYPTTLAAASLAEMGEI